MTARSSNSLFFSEHAQGGQEIKNVLVVDATPSFTRMAERVLGNWSKRTWQVFGVNSYDLVLPRLVEEWVDAIVLDIDVPGEDGLTFLALLHDQFPSIAKIVLTDRPSGTVRGRSFEYGARAYLQKPRSVEEMDSVFQSLNGIFSCGMKGGFRGTVWVSGINEVLQLECLHRRSCIIQVASGANRGRVFIEDGEIVHAETNDGQGMSALQSMLAWAEGAFHVQRFKAPTEKTIHSRWETLLLEAAFQKDEETNFFVNRQLQHPA